MNREMLRQRSGTSFQKQKFLAPPGAPLEVVDTGKLIAKMLAAVIPAAKG